MAVPPPRSKQSTRSTRSAPPTQTALPPRPSQRRTSSSEKTRRLATLADAPVDDDAADRLAMGDIADGLALLIDGEETATPLTVAVSAPWGAGKTSLLRLVRNRLVRWPLGRGEAPHIVVWFNAWMHDAAPDLSAALAASIAREANRHRPWWIRLWRPIPSSMLSPKERATRRRWLVAVSLLPALALVPILSGVVEPPDADVDAVRTQLGGAAATWFAVLWVAHAAWSRVKGGVAALAAFVDDPSAAASTGSMHEVSEQLGELIDEARRGSAATWGTANRPPNFVVIIDDLERCQPPKAVDVCEVAAQLLHHEGVVTVLVGDMRVIAASAELKYHDAAARFSADPSAALEGWGDYGRFYLQKVVQFELELPPVTPERLRAMASSTAASSAIWGKSSHPKPPRTALDVVRRGLEGVASVVATTVGLLALWGDRRGLVVLPAIGVVVAGALVGGWFELRRQQARGETRRREVIGRRAEHLVRHQLATPDAILTEDAVVAAVIDRYRAIEQTAPGEESLVEAVARSTYARLRAEEGEDRRLAEEAVLALLPPLPRTAKRLLNRLRFLMVVANGRGLFEVVEPAHVGKWAVLLDRWPHATRAVVARPTVVAELEAIVGQPKAFGAAAERLPGVGADLADWLRTEFLPTDPPLGDVASVLAYLDRSAPKE